MSNIKMNEKTIIEITEEERSFLERACIRAERHALFAKEDPFLFGFEKDFDAIKKLKNKLEKKEKNND